MTTKQSNRSDDDSIRRAIYRALEWSAESKSVNKQDLCEVVMSELRHSSPTKAHAIIDTMVAMQYLIRAAGERENELWFEPTVYGTRLLNAMARYYETR